MPRPLTTIIDLPAGPPPEVLEQIDVAWGRARELFAADLELRFEVDAALGTVWAELQCRRIGRRETLGDRGTCARMR